MGRGAQPGVSYVGHRVAPRSEADAPHGGRGPGLSRQTERPARRPARAAGRGEARAARRHRARPRRPHRARAIRRTLRRPPPPHPRRGAPNRARGAGVDRRDRRHGRKQLCLHSDIDLLILFGGIWARPKSGCSAPSCTRSGISASWWATRSGKSTSSPASRWTTRVPHGAGRRAAGRGRPRALPPLSKPRSTRRHPRARRRRAEHAHRRALRALQLDALSARAERQGRAWHAARSDGDPLDRGATDPTPLRRGPEDLARLERPRISCCESARFSTCETKRNANQLSHPLQEKTADILEYPGRFRSSASSG